METVPSGPARIADVAAFAGVGVATGLGREATAILSTVIALVILGGVRMFKPLVPHNTDDKPASDEPSKRVE